MIRRPRLLVLNLLQCCITRARVELLNLTHRAWQPRQNSNFCSPSRGLVRCETSEVRPIEVLSPAYNAAESPEYLMPRGLLIPN
jgi:hypothetical protein